jgi:hypothetical protein
MTSGRVTEWSSGKAKMSRSGEASLSCRIRNLFGLFLLATLPLGHSATFSWAQESPAAAAPAPKASSPQTPATDAGAENPMIEAVDIPTADILDPSTYALNFRFYNEGGIVSRLVIGPLKRVNLGIAFDAQRVIGSQDPHMVRPSIYFKLRAFDGTDILPALALGYDSQGYLYRESTRNFLEKEKGLYVVGSHEIFIPDFELHAGVNVNDFDNAKIYGFFGATYKIVPSFAVMAEYDNVRNNPTNRVNLGGRYWINSNFNVDLAARNVGRGAARGGERIVRLNYTAHFPF